MPPLPIPIGDTGPHPALAVVALGLFAVWILLTFLSVALFEREAILTRWR